ncbi:MAG TPA: hypothetical protein VJW73_10510 [Gemmatimonadaceae bacterium]|nr:hypothetical protein [Gemmatimonadaceae bacterium]
MRFVLYLVIACVASTLQFDLFDCNDARPLSFAAGALTILVALVAIDRLYTFGVSVRPVRARLALGTVTVVAGAVLAWTLAWLTMTSHMCG